MKLPIQRLFSGFVSIDAALGKLPGIMTTHPPGPEDLAVIIRQHDTYVGPKPIRVYHTHSPKLSAIEPKPLGYSNRTPDTPRA